MALKVNPIESGKILWDALPNQQLLVESELTSLWQRLKTEVPEGVLQVHYEMTQIESEVQYLLPSLEKTKRFFDRFVGALFPYFFEAEIPLNALPIPIECTRLQQVLQQKWEDKALVSMWGNGKPRRFFPSINKWFLPAEVRNWFENNSESMKQITWLDLTGLRIMACPREIGTLYNLETLSLGENCLKYFDIDLRQLTQLQQLVIRDNQLSNFSPNLSECTELSRLILKGNKLTSFSTDLSGCVKLSVLSLEENKLTNFSANLSHAIHLKELTLSHNRLKTLSTDLSKCTGLWRLELSHNHLESIDLPYFPNLFMLLLSSNALKTFSYDLGQWTNLKGLSINDNFISSFDPSLFRHKHLDLFRYSGNPGSPSYQWL